VGNLDYIRSTNRRERKYTERPSKRMKNGTSSPKSNGRSHHQYVTLKHEGTKRYDVRRAELVRILIQSLDNLGYEKSREMLEKESGICMDSSDVILFKRFILNGNWKKSIEMLPKLPLRAGEHILKFEILKQKFLEYLCEDNINSAIQCLREEITSVVDLCKEKNQGLRDSLHELTRKLLQDPDVLKKEYQGNEDSFQCSRELVLKKIMQQIDEHAATPESRLDTLLIQGLENQILRTPFRYAEKRCFSLLRDHDCEDVKIPTQSLHILDAHTDEVWHLAFSNKGKSLATASKDGTVIIWEHLEQEKIEFKTLIGHSGPVMFVTWSPDDARVLSSSVTHRIKLWSVKTSNCIRTFTGHTGDPVALSFLPCGTKFLSGSVDKLVNLWNAESGSICSHWSGDAVHDLIVSSDGTKIFTATSSKEIREYHIESGDSKLKIQEKGQIMSMMLADNDRHLFLQIANEGIRVWDLFDTVVLQHYRGPRCSRYVIRSSLGGYDQNLIASGSEDSQIYIWHRRTGELLRVLSGHSATVSSVAWSPQYPCILASASDDHSVRLWGC